MIYSSAEDGMDPALELWIDGIYGGEEIVVRCAGRLDGSTRASLLDVVSEVIDLGAPALVVDITQLEVHDAQAASALSSVQHLVKQRGRQLIWKGLESSSSCVPIA